MTLLLENMKNQTPKTAAIKHGAAMLSLNGIQINMIIICKSFYPRWILNKPIEIASSGCYKKSCLTSAGAGLRGTFRQRYTALDMVKLCEILKLCVL